MSNNDWVKHCTIFEFLGGSHAYGLNTETSDEDIRGICIPPEKYWLGLTRFDQADKFQNEDKVIYNIKKFVELAADCNPNIIEFLYLTHTHETHQQTQKSYNVLPNHYYSSSNTFSTLCTTDFSINC